MRVYSERQLQFELQSIVVPFVLYWQMVSDYKLQGTLKFQSVGTIICKVYIYIYIKGVEILHGLFPSSQCILRDLFS